MKIGTNGRLIVPTKLRKEIGLSDGIRSYGSDLSHRKWDNNKPAVEYKHEE